MEAPARLGKTQEAQALFDEIRRGPGPGPVFSPYPSVIGRFVPYKVVRKPPPVYPRQAWKSRTEGEIRLEGIVDSRRLRWSGIMEEDSDAPAETVDAHKINA
jgi:hypothetical protein